MTPRHPPDLPGLRRLGLYRRAGVTDPLLREGYAVCRAAVRDTGEVEYAASLVLPPPLRLATWALYGAARVIDDLADTGTPGPERLTRLERWHHDLVTDLRRGSSADPMRAALVHTMLAWELPQTSFDSVLAALAPEAETGREFATWAEWERYTADVNVPFLVHTASALAGSAGLPPMLHWAFQSLELWDLWARASFLTDALCDLGEDAARGRLTLPAEALDQYGVDRADLLAGRWTAQLAAMVRALAAQAQDLFDRLPSVPLVLHPAIAVTMETLVALYRLRLREAVRMEAALLRRRPGLPRLRTLRLLVPARARAATAWSLRPLRVAGSLSSMIGLPQETYATAPGPPQQRRTPSESAARQTPGEAGHPPAPAPRPHASGARPPAIPRSSLPRHVAIVMDGNGRWATGQGLPRTEGHKAGVESLIDVVHGAREMGLEYLTVFAFSTENWKRSRQEVEALMGITTELLRDRRDEFAGLERGVRVRWAGRRTLLPPETVRALIEAERETADARDLTLTVCVNYGGRAEITDAAARIAREVQAGRLIPEAVSEQLFARYLDEPELPDVDLFLRTGGDQRTSNFLPWQSVYAELVFLEAAWPRIDRRDLWHAVEIFARRSRRFGGVQQPAAPQT
ncbi:polyprenyl diphosphate synthase [Streptomyces sp. NPDC002446]